MIQYAVTVWDRNRSEDSEIWTMESPPVRVVARDSYEAALKVARRGDPEVKLRGIARPREGKGMFFLQEDMDFVFEVEAGPRISPEEEPLSEFQRIKTRAWRKHERTKPSGEFEETIEPYELEARIRQIGPDTYEVI